MRGAVAWHDARILNLSSRGLMLQTDRPPERGAYLEVRRGAHVIVARVVWTEARRVGLKAQDVLPVDAIVYDQPVAVRTEGRKVERRRTPRAQGSPCDSARLRGRWMQACALFLVAIGAGLLALAIIGQALGSSLDRVSAALAAGGR